MAGALTVLLIVPLLQSALCQQSTVSIPQTVEVMSGSCLTIPCSFNIRNDLIKYLNTGCAAIWTRTDNRLTSSFPAQTTEQTGDLTKNDCTTTFNNISNHHSSHYYFRLDCHNTLRETFLNLDVNILVKADPPSPLLTPSTLEVEEGTTVNITCSAPAPCEPHPPTLTWTPILGKHQDRMQEKQDKTKVKISTLTFTASHHHDREVISCTAVYKKQDGSHDVSVTSVTAAVLYSPKNTTVSVSPSGPVPENSNVTLTCSSKANPAVRNYTWYRTDESRETLIGTGHILNIEASKVSTAFFCKAANEHGVGRSVLSQIDVQYSPKDTTVSVSPSGPVPENSNVTLTCSSKANPAVRNYTWYRTDESRETLIGTGHILNIEASKVSTAFFCKAANEHGVGRSNFSQIDVQYSPKDTTVSVSPSGPVPENSDVTLTCSSKANPAVRNYTWYRTDGSQETFIGTGHILNIEASKVSTAFFCKAENKYGVGRSSNQKIDVQFPPKILPSSNCTTNVSWVSCFCDTLGNPSPTLQWYLDGLPVNQSSKAVKLQDGKSLRGFITMNQTQEKVLSTLLCRSVNSLGSASQQFCFNKLQHQISAKSLDGVLLPGFIVAVAILLILVCALVFVIRMLKNHHKSELTVETKATAASQHLIGEENEAPKTREETIYANVNRLREADVATPNVGPSNEASKGAEKNRRGSEVIYSSVNWTRKSKKKKTEDSVDMEMGSLYDEMESKNVRKQVECQYAQVKFKRSVLNK
ncbi:B-cell receptor CD22-like [Parambassis ranga]|uniref:B-cell receptor CD22-like n=1 Tax=Parambassis ranga TaxID=210632 RepID=A0A6P7JWS4_9TELE|nr:B-cell receptor CD22-like [Parambassis ranga]